MCGREGEEDSGKVQDDQSGRGPTSNTSNWTGQGSFEVNAVTPHVKTDPNPRSVLGGNAELGMSVL